MVSFHCLRLEDFETGIITMLAFTAHEGKSLEMRVFPITGDIDYRVSVGQERDSRVVSVHTNLPEAIYAYNTLCTRINPYRSITSMDVPHMFPTTFLTPKPRELDFEGDTDIGTGGCYGSSEK